MDINVLMKNLGLSEGQAKELIENDKRIDKMKKVSDVNSDLSDEQKKIAKKARAASRKKQEFPQNREKKINEPKKEILSLLAKEFINEDNFTITNDEREFTFIRNGVLYKVNLSCPRIKL